MTLYKSEKERSLHSSVISSIADQYQLEEDFVRDIYEYEFTKLDNQAHIKAYLPVLTTRHVKEVIHTQARGRLKPSTH